MPKILLIILMLFTSLSFAEKYDEDGYCETDQYQEMKKCLLHNIELIQSKIESLSIKYKEELKSDEIEGFDRVQEEWANYVSSTCRLHAQSAGKGSIKSIRSMSCNLHAKERRVLEIGCMISYHMGDGNEYQRYCKKYFDTREKI